VPFGKDLIDRTNSGPKTNDKPPKALFTRGVQCGADQCEGRLKVRNQRKAPIGTALDGGGRTHGPPCRGVSMSTRHRLIELAGAQKLGKIVVGKLGDLSFQQLP